MSWPLDSGHRYQQLVGVGGIGSGMVFALEGTHTLGRTESRAARLLPVRDYCKLHIVAYYIASLRGPSVQVRPIGRVGNDERGRALMREMQAAGIDTTFVMTHPTLPTLLSVCFEYPDGDGGNITSTVSACGSLDADGVDAALEAIAGPPVSGGEGLILLAVPEADWNARRRLLEIGTARHALRVAAFTALEIPRALADGSMAMIDLVAMNREEAETLTRATLDLDRVARTLTAVQPGIRIIVTAGRDGAFGFAQGAWSRRPALPVSDAHAAGAGDALLAGALAAITAGAPFIQPDESGEGLWRSALDFGVFLSAYSVTSPHTIHPDLRRCELRRFADAHDVRFGDPIASELLM
jgi:sugar/nucleoside kinase (ribokinase family)